MRRGHYWRRARYPPIGCDWASKSLRSTNFSISSRAGTHSHWGTKHSTKSNPSRVISWLFLTSQWYQKNWMWPFHKPKSIFLLVKLAFIAGEENTRAWWALADDSSRSTTEPMESSGSICSISSSIKRFFLSWKNIRAPYPVILRYRRREKNSSRLYSQRIGRWIKESRLWKRFIGKTAKKIRKF